MATRQLVTLHKKFTVIAGPDPRENGFWTKAQLEVLDISSTHIWTEVDSGAPSFYLVPGLVHVNRTGQYVVTENTWFAEDMADEYRVESSDLTDYLDLTPFGVYAAS
jgi:hypothetical protein